MPKHATDETETEERIRYLSPPEYIKFANARDHRVKHSVDLHHFIAWLQENPGLLRELPVEKVDNIVDDYLTEVEPEDV